VIDLHVHSSCSDGSDTPEEICELAVAAGLRAVALTDHDTLEGIPAARARAAELELELVAGCEVSCAFSPGTLHLLCYFVEPGRGPLAEELRALSLDRVRRNEAMARRLAALGLPVDYEEVLAEAGGGEVGRPHFAAVLVRHGAAANVQEAFDRYLAKGAPGYVSKARLDPEAAIETAHASGAVAVLAHPLSLALDAESLDAAVSRLADAGLDGLECHYGRYTLAERERLAALAGRLGLAVTGGSDYHGRYKPDLALGRGRGDLAVPDDLLEQLAARRPGEPWHARGR
jgi:predicted metal-dependent phosphoesterase TrpH